MGERSQHTNNPRQLDLFDKESGHKPKGNKHLIGYGIQNEASDMRVHVCIEAQSVYIFPTESGRQALRENPNLTRRNISLDGKIVTAEGFAVPVSSIPNIEIKLIPNKLMMTYPIHQTETTTQKGTKAVAITLVMLKNGDISLPLNGKSVPDLEFQVSGSDIIVNSDLRVQVKCDYRGGERRLGGTGNLFLQIAECNPYKMY